MELYNKIFKKKELAKVLIFTKDLRVLTYYRIPFLRQSNKFVQVGDKYYRTDVELGDKFSMDNKNIKTFVYMENEPIPVSVLGHSRSVITSEAMNELANDKFVRDILSATFKKTEINSWLIALGVVFLLGLGLLAYFMDNGFSSIIEAINSLKDSMGGGA